MKKLAKILFVTFCLLAILTPLLADVAAHRELAAANGVCVWTCGDGTTGQKNTDAGDCAGACADGCAGNGGCSSFGWAKIGGAIAH